MTYSRLNPTSNVKSSQSVASLAATTASTAGNVSRRIIRCLSKPKIAPLTKYARANGKSNEEVEREWLLLGEPQLARNTVVLDDDQDPLFFGAGSSRENQPTDVESALISDGKENASSSESSTDIDAIVDEYRQKVKIATVTPQEQIKKVASAETWKLAIVCVLMTLLCIVVSVIGLHSRTYSIFACGLLGKEYINIL